MSEESKPMVHLKSQPKFTKIIAILGLFLIALIAIILIIGLVPVSKSGLSSQANPVTTYEDSIARFQQIQDQEQGITNDSTRSVLLTHGEKTPRVYLLIHGITNSPLQWSELGKHLYDQGSNVLILRMPYHGLQSLNVSELKILKSQDLRAYADQAVDIAVGLGEDVDVVGISGGGTISSWLAENRPEVSKSILLAPFFGPIGVPDFLNPLLVNAFSRLPNMSFFNPAEPLRDWVYRGEATRGVAAFLGIGNTVESQVKDGICPEGQVVILTTPKDDTANNRSTTRIIDLWHKAGCDIVTFQFDISQDIPHNSVDPAADPSKKHIVYNKILEFLEEPPMP
jgi:pimeloyl-ACP methyl ester carboxylesterase